MKQKVISIIQNPLFSGSAIMILGSNFANFIAYLYHVIIGRLLGPAAYGEFSAILSVISLFMVSFTFLSLVIVKFVSSASKKSLPDVLSWFNHKAIFFAIFSAVGVLLLSPFLANFLHSDLKIMLLLSPIFFFSVLGLVYRSFLHGLLRFGQVVIFTNIDLVVRMFFGVAFVLLGFSVFGVVLGFLLAVLVSFLVVRWFLRKYRLSGSPSRFKETKKVFAYSLPIFIASIATNSFFTTDVILVKHFLVAHDAGLYAALSTLGKIIFYGTAPVIAVMFPLVAKRHSQGNSYRKILLASMFLVTLIASGVIFIYWLLPELMVQILYGREFLPAAEHLFLFGVFMGVFTLDALLINFFLSVEKIKPVIAALIAALGQIIGIWFFHGSLVQVIQVSILSTFLLLGFLLIYLGYGIKEKRAL